MLQLTYFFLSKTFTCTLCFCKLALMLSIGSLNYNKGQFQYGDWKKPNALWSVCHTSVSTTRSKFHSDIHWINYGVVVTEADKNDGKRDDSNEREHILKLQHEKAWNSGGAHECPPPPAYCLKMKVIYLDT